MSDTTQIVNGVEADMKEGRPIAYDWEQYDHFVLSGFTPWVAFDDSRGLC